MDIDQIRLIVENAVTKALVAHREMYEVKLKDLINKRETYDCTRNENVLIPIDRLKFCQYNFDKDGLVVSNRGVSPLSVNIEDISYFPEPSNLYQLTIFLSLIRNYRRFIKDFAIYVKPLTDILRSKDGDKLSSHEAREMKICLNVEQLTSFNHLRLILSSGDVTQALPNYTESFQLTTYCSTLGLGATFTQNNKNIYIISRTLKDAEKHYSANEMELITIIWAFVKHKTILVNAQCINIFSDYQHFSYEPSCSTIILKLQQLKIILSQNNLNLLSKSSTTNSERRLIPINKTIDQLVDHHPICINMCINSFILVYKQLNNFCNSFYPSVQQILPGEGCGPLKFDLTVKRDTIDPHKFIYSAKNNSQHIRTTSIEEINNNHLLYGEVSNQPSILERSQFNTIESLNQYYDNHFLE